MTPSQTVLVVDDHVTLAQAFAMALERAGYSVQTAHTAEDGLRLARSGHPSAVVLDLKMPFVNGAGFLYRLREYPEHSRTPVIVVTGAAVNEEMRADLAQLGAVLRFKPMGLRELLDEVRALLGSREPANERPASRAGRPSTKSRQN
jgi:DNA-binding response OmpR family regulator